ncbi:MAG: DUF488 family protein [Anaerolineae bacterium]
MASTVVVYTIGHSNHTLAAFLDLIRQHEIDTIVDVRSQPYSQWADQFNREVLKQDLKEAGVCYLWMGDQLGGRPAKLGADGGPVGHPNYKEMAEEKSYLEGIATLIELARDRRVAVMCSEGDHTQCHRHLLITQTLVSEGVRVLHIRPDATLVEGALEPEQLTLF